MIRTVRLWFLLHDRRSSDANSAPIFYAANQASVSFAALVADGMPVYEPTSALRFGGE